MSNKKLSGAKFALLLVVNIAIGLGLGMFCAMLVIKLAGNDIKAALIYYITLMPIFALASVALALLFKKGLEAIS